MSYKWNVKIHMVGGVMLYSTIDSEQETPVGVVEEIMRGGDDTFHSINDKGQSKLISFRRKYVSALEITPA